MALASTPTIDVAALAPLSLPEKAILWPSVKNWEDPVRSDLTQFPNLQEIKTRNSATTPEPLHAFTAAARQASQRILVLDDFLFDSHSGKSEQARYDQILQWLPEGLAANDVRLLTNSRGTQSVRASIEQQFSERATRINQVTPRRIGRVTIQIKFTLGTTFDYVHDRFAIIDNELWHFGATVGGLHNRLNAATRGWDAEIHDAVRFFNDAWKGDGDTKRGRHRG